MYVVKLIFPKPNEKKGIAASETIPIIRTGRERKKRKTQDQQDSLTKYGNHGF